MQHRTPAWKPALLLLVTLLLAGLACTLPGSSAPEATTAPAAPAVVPGVTAEVKGTAALPPTAKPTRVIAPTAEPSVALDTYRSADGLFTVKYPAEWTLEEQSGGMLANGPDKGWGLATYAEAAEEDKTSQEALEKVVRDFSANLESKAGYELLDEDRQDDQYTQEFKADSTDTNVLLHAILHVRAVGNYVFVMVFAVPDEDWEEWQSTADAVLESLEVDEKIASRAPEPTAEPSTGDLTVVSQRAYQDEWDYWYITGEVRNDSGEPLEYVTLAVELFDAKDKSLSTDTVYVARNVIPPGEVSPFLYSVDSSLETFDHFTLAIEDSSSSDVELVPLEVSNESLQIDESGAVYLVGEVTNSSRTAVEIGEISASFYAGGDFVVGDSGWPNIHYLEPGDTGPFMVHITGPQADVDSYQVFIDAEEASYTEPADVTIDNEQLYQDEDGDWHFTGEVTNNSDVSLSVSLISSVYDNDGKLVDVNSGSSFLSFVGGVAPGETDAFDITYFDLIDEMGLSAGDLEATIMVDSYLTYESSTELVGNLVEGNEDQEVDGDRVVFTGELENQNDFDVEEVIVVIVVKDTSTGKVVGASYVWLSDPIPAGESEAYSVTVYLLAGMDHDNLEYAVYARGRAPE